MSPYLKLSILFLFCYASSPAKHSFSLLATSSSGVQHLPEYVFTIEIDDIHLDYFDSNKEKATNFSLWENSTDPSKWYFEQVFQSFPAVLRMIRNALTARNKNEGVHILQIMAGCDWDEKAADIGHFCHYGYNGEDFMELDLKTLTWIPQHPQAVAFKPQWDSDKSAMKYFESFLIQICPEWLKNYVNKSRLKRADHTSVSLLQRSPSSPVSCHATGFFPKTVEMFWRKDGKEIHDGVKLGDILPNSDGTFQMSADLNISLVAAEDWSRYDCVFKVSGAENNIITRLKQSAIRTNWVSPSGSATVAVIAVVGFLLLSIIIAGLTIWKKNKNGFRPTNTNDCSE